MRGLEEGVLTKMNGVWESNMRIYYTETQIKQHKEEMKELLHVARLSCSKKQWVARETVPPFPKPVPFPFPTVS